MDDEVLAKVDAFLEALAGVPLRPELIVTILPGAKWEERCCLCGSLLLTATNDNDFPVALQRRPDPVCGFYGDRRQCRALPTNA
jgi:hypothetical protein